MHRSSRSKAKERTKTHQRAVIYVCFFLLGDGVSCLDLRTDRRWRGCVFVGDGVSLERSKTPGVRRSAPGGEAGREVGRSVSRTHAGAVTLHTHPQTPSWNTRARRHTSTHRSRSRGGVESREEGCATRASATHTLHIVHTLTH